jgi:predicted acetyltransferase
MDIEYRAIEPDEFDEFLEVDRIGFGQSPRKEGTSDSWARGELDRTRGAFDGGRMVGAGRNYTFEVTVPGGELLPAAAVSWISVLPTHRRRGVLTGMMNALHRDARDRGEPVSILTASESVIYGRFGYGVATWRLALAVDRAHARFARDIEDDGRVRFLTDDESLKVFPPVYDAARRMRAGMVTRPDFWWPEGFDWLAEEFSPTFRVAHEDRNGTVDGFAFYGVAGEWMNGISTKQLTVVDLVSLDPSARAALWRFLFGVDLVTSVRAGMLPVDEPLRFLLADSRRARVEYVNDGMWVRIHDEVAALSARTYDRDGSIVLEVHRPDGTAATLEVDGGPDGAQCRATTASPDVVLGSAQLGSVFLGGVSFRELHDAGLVDEATPGAIARADAMFTTRPVPTMTSWF